MIRTTVLAACLLTLTPFPAYAYVDPGTATIVIQAIIGGIAAAGFYFRTALYRLARLVRPGRKAESEATNGKPNE